VLWACRGVRTDIDILSGTSHSCASGHCTELRSSTFQQCGRCVPVYRYEKTAFQQEVQRGFDALQDASWTVLDASKSIEDLQAEVWHRHPCSITRSHQTEDNVCLCLHPWGMIDFVKQQNAKAVLSCLVQWDTYLCCYATMHERVVQHNQCEILCTQVQAAAAAVISRCRSGTPVRKLWRAASPPLTSIGNTYS